MTDLELLQNALIKNPNDKEIFIAMSDCLEDQGQIKQPEYVRLWIAEVCPEFELPVNPERRRRLERKKISLPLPKYTNSIGMEFVWIPSGRFIMGSVPEEFRTNYYYYNNRLPNHNVSITKKFYMSIYQVTQQQYNLIMGYNPSYFRGLLKPVEKVDWNESMNFCRKLSELPKEKEKGYSYRLPTEAEWEYCCRGGGVECSLYHFGNTITKKEVNYLFNNRSTKNVGSYFPNSFGLYDMHGNVWEWCFDAKRKYLDRDETNPQGLVEFDYNTFRSIRGGSYSNQKRYCASSYRGSVGFQYIDSSLGFRVICENNSHF